MFSFFFILSQPVTILLGRTAQRILDIFTEKRQVGKFQIFGDFLDGLIGMRQQVTDALCHSVAYPLRSGAPAHFGTDSGQILRRNTQLVRIKSDVTGLDVVISQQFGKPPE